jgi:hypothetical protein
MNQILNLECKLKKTQFRCYLAWVSNLDFSFFSNDIFFGKIRNPSTTIKKLSD